MQQIWYPPPSQPSSGGSGFQVRVPRPILVVLLLLTVGLLTGHTRSPRGLVVVGAAWLLVSTWNAARGRFLRVLALGLLLVFSAPAPLPERPVRPPVRAGTSNKGVEKARVFVGDRFACFASGYSRFKPECYVDGTAPKEGR
jgi:hypothetical protein